LVEIVGLSRKIDCSFTGIQSISRLKAGIGDPSVKGGLDIIKFINV
jgi:hypothetical protein